MSNGKCGMSNDYDALMRKAQATNRDRDLIDRKLGLASPSGGDMRALFSTALTAIEAGIKRSDWNAVAEGLVMLHEVQDKTVIVGIAHKTPGGAA